MPLKQCQSDGESGWKWGDEGKCFTGQNAKQKAIEQALAIGDGEMPEKSDIGGTMDNLTKKFAEWFIEKFDETEDVVDKTEEGAEEETEDEEVEKSRHMASRMINNVLDRVSKSKEDRADLIGKMASQAGITKDAVRKVLNGKVKCPPRENLINFSKALDTDANRLIQAARMDGCDMDLQKGVNSEGSEEAKVAFIGASPSKVDVIRGKPFAGKVAKTISDTYLDELDVEKSEVAFLHLVPVLKETEDGSPREPTMDEIEEWSDHFKNELKKYNPKILVALGTKARDGLEKIFDRSIDETIDEFVPHPRAIQIHGDSGEVSRKFARLNKTLEELDKVEKSTEEQTTLETNVLKADDELQVVKGIVLEPEREDADGNWTTRTEIERAAHNFLKSGSGMVTHEHVLPLEDAHIVESHITEKDQIVNDQKVRAGSWVVGIQVEDENQWQKVKEGEYSGFSIGASAKIDPSMRLEE